MTNTSRAFIATLFVVAVITAIPGAQQAEHKDVPRDQWQRVADVVAALGIVPGSHVADLGAGGGFFTTRLAKAVGPTGKVYAVDVNPISLRELKDNLGPTFPNVEIVRGEENDPRLPAGRLDGVLVVNAYHEFADYPDMLRHIRAALKPGGRFVLIEPIPRRAEDTTRTAQTKNHTIAIELVEADLAQAGFEIVTRDPAFVTRPEHQGEAARPASPTGATDWLLVARPRSGSRPF
jgi:predicted methyltransferase